MALAVTDGRWISPHLRRVVAQLPPTTDFLYVRLLGLNRDIVDHSRIEEDRSDELLEWSIFMQRWRPQILSYIYLNNDLEGHSPASARALQRLFGQSPIEPDTLGDQLSLL